LDNGGMWPIFATDTKENDNRKYNHLNEDNYETIDDDSGNDGRDSNLCLSNVIRTGKARSSFLGRQDGL
jgi:hypothetical protein